MIKDLMVHLDGSEEDAVRIAHAEALGAALGDIRLTGLFTNALPEYAYVLGVQSGMADMGPVIELEQQLRREGDRIVALLADRLRRPDAACEVRRIDEWPSLIPQAAASQARCADLFLASTPYRDTPGAQWDRLTEAVLFEGGRALVLVPPACPVRTALRTVLVAWKDTRESARAVAEALPILKAAGRVVLLTIDTGEGTETAAGATDIAAHLDRHGVRIEVFATEAKPVDVGHLVLDRAASIGADLIVLGAFGHSRLREWVLGGATRDVIEGTAVPLLMAH